VVAAFSDRQLDEMFAVMAELEALCARWAAIAMNAEERRRLLHLQDESALLVSAGQREAYADFNNRFHEAIYRGAHNSFLAELALSVRTRCAPFRRAQFETLGRLAKSHTEHGRVVAAIQRGDAETAAMDMRAHIDVVRGAVDEVAGESTRLSARTGENVASTQASPTLA
jgi:DNA-binding GntR family transcriptional regulator